MGEIKISANLHIHVYDGLTKTLSRENTTDYEIANLKDVVFFLEAHRGEYVFTVSW